MRPITKKLLAMSLAGSLALAACGDDDTDVAQSGGPAEVEDTTPATESETEAQAEVASTESGAAELRAGLTSLLQEHVYLAGITVEAALDAGGDMEAPAVKAAAAALDENTVALSDAVASVAGEENGEAFKGLWREHIGFFVDYTLGKATGDQAMLDQALTDLDGYQEAAGAFFEEITGGELPADALIESLEVHIDTLTAAIDALVAGDATAFDKLQAAADHMPMTANALAGAIVAAVPDQFDGEVDSGAAETRAVLTDLLQEHVYLAGITVDQAVEAGGDMEAPAVQAAAATLDGNTVELAEVVGSVSTPEDQEAFLGLWRAHIGFFVDYTLGKATGDQAMVDQALTDLDGYQEAAGAFFEEITGGELPAEALIESLEEHITTLTQAIDAVVAGDASAFSELRQAGQHMPMAALALSSAIVAATS
ncbi:MAG: copper amine oxidase [Acidimicrobiia bacterium]